MLILTRKSGLEITGECKPQSYVLRLFSASVILHFSIKLWFDRHLAAFTEALEVLPGSSLGIQSTLLAS